ncbi:MAG: hypothetical protein JWP88_651 [Flaviaesturariibacter sp.]|nr:hypothetical protein [Flaviaesturariibacter sp.]
MKNLLLFLLLISGVCGQAQELSKAPALGFSTGLINYEGDLKPNSFTFNQSNPYFSVYVVKPLLSRVNLRAGVGMGKVEAADRNNRDYLQQRNLSFKSGIKEVYAGLELYLLSTEMARFNPYVFVGGAVFHFDPWAIDGNGKKVYLQPLSTEGQGLAAYPSRKVYSLTQYALCLSGGFKYRINDNISLGWELSQRKTFTDYLDDVSSSYVDRDKLFAAKGQQAVDMAFRGGEVSTSNLYPHDGEQRGTPTENDWYYYFGLTMEVKLSAVKDKLTSAFKGSHDKRINRCPSVF